MEKNRAISTVFKTLIYLIAILAFNYVDANTIFTSQIEGNKCLDDGSITCQLRRNNSESMCCLVEEFGSDNCTSIPGNDQVNFYNFEFCSTEVFTHPVLTEFSLPFETDYCQMSPCLYGRNNTLLDNDCTFHNPFALELCLGICKEPECLRTCFETQNVILDSKLETAALHPFLAMCTDQCAKNQQNIQLDPLFNNETIISGAFDKNHPTSCQFNAYAVPDLLQIGSAYYSYQLEINITSIKGVTVTVLNGTTIYGADDIETTSEKRNFTYNATDFN